MTAPHQLHEALVGHGVVGAAEQVLDDQAVLRAVVEPDARQVIDRHARRAPADFQADLVGIEFVLEHAADAGLVRQRHLEVVVAARNEKLFL